MKKIMLLYYWLFQPRCSMPDGDPYQRALELRGYVFEGNEFIGVPENYPKPLWGQPTRSIYKELIKLEEVAHLPPYPKWKENIPAEPSEEQFLAAWKRLFDHDYSQCNVQFDFVFWNLPPGVLVTTPTMQTVHGGLMEEHTDAPVLKEGQTIFFSGCGTTYDTDSNGRRFPLIIRETMFPRTAFLDMELIRRYFESLKDRAIREAQNIINH
jgi:hypothetical protein